MQAFGASEGLRLKEKYAQLQPQSASDLKRLFESAAQGSRTDVAVQVYRRDAEPRLGVIRAALEVMSDPARIYTATGSSPNGKSGGALGNFVYVDGGFRFLSGQVLQALSTAPVVRVRMGGNVMGGKLVNKVQPIYPPGALAAHGLGPVVIHTVIGIDGVPKEVTVVSGDPELAKAAVEAVRRWRYSPTLLNGAPVEVDTTISINFEPLM